MILGVRLGYVHGLKTGKVTTIEDIQNELNALSEGRQPSDYQ